jgi:hypothetical protein
LLDVLLRMQRQGDSHFPVSTENRRSHAAESGPSAGLGPAIAADALEVCRRRSQSKRVAQAHSRNALAGPAAPRAGALAVSPGALSPAPPWRRGLCAATPEGCRRR